MTIQQHFDIASVWIVIAAYNEASVIGKTLEDILQTYPNVVVTDDCSTDTTWDVVRASGAHLLRHPINLGQGAALQTGIDYAVRHNAQFIVTFDADGQHDPADIAPMLEKLRETGVSVVLGSRFLGKTVNMSASRRALLSFAILFTRLSAGIRLTDVHNGLRVMTREFCTRFAFRQNRMAHASEILNYIARSRTRFTEAPVTIRYTEYSIRKGQRGINSARILMELLMGFIAK